MKNEILFREFIVYIFFNCGSTHTHVSIICFDACAINVIYAGYVYICCLHKKSQRKNIVRKIVATHNHTAFSKIAICDISLRTFTLSQLCSAFKNKLGIENRATAINVSHGCCCTTDALWKMATEKNGFE